MKHELDFSKQSKWVQEAVEDMQRTIRRLGDRVKELSSKHPGSNVVMGGGHGEPDITLPPNSRIYFYAGEPQDWLTNMIEIHHDIDNPERIYIAAYGSGGVRILPSATNSFYLELNKRLCG